MFYITVRQSPRQKQMTIEELLFQDFDVYSHSYVNVDSITNTHTYAVEQISQRFYKNLGIVTLIEKLKRFNLEYEELRNADRRSLYYEFYIPKKSGGLRKIDAPEKELKDALYKLKDIFEQDFHALYHTSAFAYIKKRGIIDCIKRHQENNSKWFCKLDLHDFFGSTTIDFVMNMMSMIFPFSEVIKIESGAEELRKALSLCFLDGGLPQGTPISPLLTNIMMIPIDFTLSNKLRLRVFECKDKSNNDITQRFIYTRYADDFQISSRYTFKFKDVEKLIVDTLNSFNAPFSINAKKTRYGSSSGRNWNLGVMLNKDNVITVGHQKKKQFQAMLFSYVKDKLNGKQWEVNDVQVMDGYRNYYKMVEGDSIDRIVEHVGKKFNVDILDLIKKDLRPRT